MVVSALLAASCTNCAEPAYLAENEYGAIQMIVDGKPFMMLAGELHNSSASKLLKVRGLGRKGMKEILRALDEYYKTDVHIKKYYARDEDENVDEDYCYN